MTPRPFLKKLYRQLAGFSQEQQAELLEEVSSHIESGLEDPALGGDPQARQHRLMAELGTPEEMGQRFKRVYRPNRWIDFLLVFVPVYLLIPLLSPVQYYISGSLPTPSSLAVEIRLSILIGLALVLVGALRRSNWVLAFWLPDALTRLATLMTREGRWSVGPDSRLESLAGYMLLIGLGVWLARLLWKNRADLLLVLFVLLPFLESAANLWASALSARQGIAFDYSSLNGVGYALQALSAISLAGIYLLRRRSLRWLALAVEVGSYSLSMAYGYGRNPALVVLWISLVLLTAAAWLADWRIGSRISRLTIRHG